MAKVRLNIKGVICTSCGVEIGRILRESEGVLYADVNVRAESIEVGFIPSQTDVERIIATINGIGGYTASLPDEARLSAPPSGGTP